jgi:hypothetical protein
MPRGCPPGVFGGQRGGGMRGSAAPCGPLGPVPDLYDLAGRVAATRKQLRLVHSGPALTSPLPRPERGRRQASRAARAEGALAFARRTGAHSGRSAFESKAPAAAPGLHEHSHGDSKPAHHHGRFGLLERNPAVVRNSTVSATPLQTRGLRSALGASRHLTVTPRRVRPLLWGYLP